MNKLNGVYLAVLGDFQHTIYNKQKIKIKDFVFNIFCLFQIGGSYSDM